MEIQTLQEENQRTGLSVSNISLVPPCNTPSREVVLRIALRRLAAGTESFYKAVTSNVVQRYMATRQSTESFREVAFNLPRHMSFPHPTPMQFQCAMLGVCPLPSTSVCRFCF